jgi:hypothetical protein
MSIITSKRGVLTMPGDSAMMMTSVIESAKLLVSTFSATENERKHGKRRLHQFQRQQTFRRAVGSHRTGLPLLNDLSGV